MRGILVVDDHPVVVETMRTIVRSVFPDARIQTAGTVRATIETLRCDDNLDLVTVDLDLPDARGLGVVEHVMSACSTIAVVVVSAFEDRDTIVAALRLGARGYLPKTSKPGVMGAALRVVAEGGTYIPPQALTDSAGDFHRQELTTRQRDVLRLMAKGFANKQIANHLRIATETVKHHARTIYSILGVESRADAWRAAEQRGIRLD
jgi:DNA-binding NarL/FixJ family response regulator